MCVFLSVNEGMDATMSPSTGAYMGKIHEIRSNLFLPNEHDTTLTDAFRMFGSNSSMS